MEDVCKYKLGTRLMKKSMRYELVCKSPTNKMECGKRLMKKNMILCTIVPQGKWHMCAKPHKVELR